MLGVLFGVANAVARGVAGIQDAIDTEEAKKRAIAHGQDYYMKNGVPKLLSNDHAFSDRRYIEGISEYIPGAKNGDIIRMDVHKGNIKMIGNLTAPIREAEHEQARLKAIAEGKTAYLYEYIFPSSKNGHQKHSYYKDIKTGQTLEYMYYNGFKYFADLNGNYVRPSDDQMGIYRKYIENNNTPKGIENKKHWDQKIKELENGAKGIPF